MVHNSTIIILLTFTLVSSEYNSSFHPVPVRNKRQESTGSCSAPSIENGKFVVLGHNYTQGTHIPNYAPVKIICNENYDLFPNQSVITCVDGSWTSSVPVCKLFCLPQISTSSVDITCTVDDIHVDCSKPLVEGTVAKSSCKRYDPTLPTQSPVSVCIGGIWDNPPIQCASDCGSATEISEFPWHVGIYRHEDDEYNFFCSGSIISPSFVITAAHCLTDEYGEIIYSADKYSVGAGKFHIDYNSSEDELHAQIRQVKKFHIQPFYKGYPNNFAADLAVIIVKKSFELTNVVQPVCVDWTMEFKKELKPDTIGKIIRWRTDTEDNLSKTLRPVTAPYIDSAVCLNILPSTFIRWLTPDKFCAGFANGSGLCPGDGGAGLVFPWKANKEEKYYLTGIASVGPLKDDGKCDPDQVSVYTRISRYTDWILGIMTENILHD